MARTGRHFREDGVVRAVLYSTARPHPRMNQNNILSQETNRFAKENRVGVCGGGGGGGGKGVWGWDVCVCVVTEDGSTNTHSHQAVSHI